MSSKNTPPVCGAAIIKGDGFLFQLPCPEMVDRVGLEPTT